MAYGTVAIDFEGVIAHYDGWKGVGIFGDPLPGVKESLQRLKEMGMNIIIHTTRGEVEHIENYLHVHGIPFDHINYNPQNFEHMNPGKPIADVYVDDRAFLFKGIWDDNVVSTILGFRPWYRRGRMTRPGRVRRATVQVSSRSGL